MNSQSIVSWELGDDERMQRLSLSDRSKLIEAACQAAVVIENARLALGWPVAESEPWPNSTWEFLRNAAKAIRNQG